MSKMRFKAIGAMLLVALDTLVMLYSASHLFNPQTPFGLFPNMDTYGMIVYMIAFIPSFAIYCYLRWDSDGATNGVRGVVITLVGLLLAIYGGSHILLVHIPDYLTTSTKCIYYSSFILGATVFAYYDYKASAAYDKMDKHKLVRKNGKQ